MRPLSPQKQKDKRDPFAPKTLNSTKPEKPSKTSKPDDKYSGGGGSIYHSSSTTLTATPISTALDSALASKKRVEGIKRDLKGSAADRELKRIFRPFAPQKPIIKPAPVVEEKETVCGDVGESVAFDARRVRGIGFDPRRRANEEVRPNADRKVSPIRGNGTGSMGKISLEGVLGGMGKKGTGAGGEMEDSDSDSDLDIVME